MMVLAGLLKMGRLLRFVANSVVIGFLTGVSINVILSQLGDFTGYSSPYENKVVKAVDTLLNLNQIDVATTAIGLLTVAIILLVNRTRLRNFSMLFGMVIASAAVILLGLTTVQQVGDIAVIPTSLPMPKLPDFSLMPVLLLDAIALAIIALVQGAGVSKAYPNPDGNYPNPSGDFIGQGAANIGAGLLQGMPIGGSVSGTALNISSGARSRWANIFSGLLVVLAVLLFSQAVSMVAMPAMAGLLIVAGFQSIKFARIQDIWVTGWAPRIVMAVTIVLTLAIPLQQAVFFGVLLSILAHFFFTSSHEVRLTLVTPQADGTVTEGELPAVLPANAVTVLDVYGNMTFAGAETLEAQLPKVKDASARRGHPAAARPGSHRQQFHCRGGTLRPAAQGAWRQADARRRQPQSQGPVGSHRHHPGHPWRRECLRGHGNVRRQHAEAIDAAQRWLQEPPVEPKDNVQVSAG